MESATDIRADINKKYRCVSNNQIHMHNVTVTLHDATIQAYLASSSFSKEGRTLPVALVPRPSSVRASVAVSLCLRKMCVSKHLCSGGLGAPHTFELPTKHVFILKGGDLFR